MPDLNALQSARTSILAEAKAHIDAAQRLVAISDGLAQMSNEDPDDDDDDDIDVEIHQTPFGTVIMGRPEDIVSWMERRH